MQLAIDLLLNPYRANGDINGVAIMLYIGTACLVACWLVERSFKGGK